MVLLRCFAVQSKDRFLWSYSLYIPKQRHWLMNVMGLIVGSKKVGYETGFVGDAAVDNRNRFM